MRDYFKLTLFLLDSSSKRKLPFLLVLFLFSSFLDLIGIGLVGIFLGVMVNPNIIFSKVKLIQPYEHLLTNNQWLFVFGFSVVAIFIVKAILALWVQGRIVKFSRAAGLKIQMRLMQGYQSVPYVFHLGRNSSHMLTRINQVGAFIGAGLIPSITLVSNFIIFALILGFLFVASFWSTVVLLAMFAGLFFIYDRVSKKKINAVGSIMATSLGELNKSINQGIGGLKEVRILGREAYFLNKFKSNAAGYINSQTLISILQLIPRYVVENALVIFMIALCLGAVISGVSSTSVVVLAGIFAAAGTRLLPVVNQIIGMSSSLRSQLPLLKMISNEINAFDEFDQCAKFSIVGQESYQKPKPFSFVELDDINYNYPTDKRNALSNVSFKFKKGDSIGLIGPSGAGKSTLVNVILGLLVPSSGEILLDGNPITNLRSWLSHFAYIPQSIYLLDDTMRRNIAFGVEDDEIDEEKLKQSTEMAQLGSVIAGLPDGFDTLVGEDGVRLSGGQRQRVALARALYFDRDIIVMDEATSALDNETEKEVIESIKRLKGNKTMIVIAHRLSTVEHCDVLYRLENGAVTKQGTYEEVVVA